MLCRHVALFGWLLKSQLRSSKKDEVVDIVRVILPNKKDVDYVLSQRQKTVAVTTTIRQVISVLGKEHRLTTAEEIALDHTAHSLSEAITSRQAVSARLSSRRYIRAIRADCSCFISPAYLLHCIGRGWTGS